MNSFSKVFQASKEEKIGSVLPEPHGPLAHSMPSSAPEAASSAVHEVLKSSINEVSIHLCGVHE